MNAVVTCAKAVFLREWRAWVSLALVAGLAGGAVLACIAGARRTDRAYPRFAQAHLAPDVMVFPPSGVNSGFDYGSLTRLPEVFAATTLHGYNTETGIVIELASGFGQVVAVPKLVSGRLPRPDEADAAAVTYVFAQSQHIHVGDLRTVNFLGSGRSTGESPPVVPIPLRIVGIKLQPGEFPPSAPDRTFQGQYLVGPAFVSANAARLGAPVDSLAVRLRHGDADGPSFEASLRRLTASRPPGASPVLEGRTAQQASDVQRGFHLQAQALLLLAGFVAIATALVVAQLLSRQSNLAAEDHVILRSLGMTRTQLWLTGVGLAVATGIGAAVLASVTAVAASPILPVGTARLADPHPGWHVDALVLGLGAATVLALLPAVSAWPAWRAARGRTEDDEPSWRPPISSRVTAGAALPPTATIGVAMALQAGRGRASVPVRSSLGAMTMAVAALAAAVAFGASLSHLLDTPRLYGWNWDVHLINNSSDRGRNLASVTQPLLSDPRVEAVAVLTSPPITVNNISVFSVTLDDLKGHISPIILSGRAPQSADEVVLGAKTMRDTHAHIGSPVDLSITVVRNLHVSKRIVGTVILPPEADAARLGVGVMLTASGLQSLIPPEVRPPPNSEAILRFSPGTDRAQLLADVRELSGPGVGVYTPTAPSDLVNFGHVQNLPFILAGLLAALALATLAHTLVSSVRRRARDLAVLRTLGFVPRQVRETVAWQATTFVSVALLVGLPIGIAAARLLWIAFADQLGTLPEPITPPLPLLLIVPAAVIAANVVARVPGFVALRAAPARALRSE